LDEVEVLIFIFAIIFALVYMVTWFGAPWPKERHKTQKFVLWYVRLFAVGIIFFVLNTMAAHDVVDSYLFITFYLVLGISALAVFQYSIKFVLDISLLDDVIAMRNPAALVVYAFVFPAAALIYSGSNIGDGPGWWCVFIACALGFFSWIIPAQIMSRITHASESITVDRNLPCAVRFGGYLLASGIIVARASAGDWTDFSTTIAEFSAAWPVLPLLVLAIVVELTMNSSNSSANEFQYKYLNGEEEKSGVKSAFWIAAVYVALAIVVEVFLIKPLPQFFIFTI